MTDPHDRPAPGTIEARNHDDAFVPGPTDHKDGVACPDFSAAKSAEQSELEMLREFEADVRQAAHSSLGGIASTARVCEALNRFDRKRGR
jgi:hypothetical protein